MSFSALLLRLAMTAAAVVALTAAVCAAAVLTSPSSETKSQLIPDSAYLTMEANIVKALDGVSGYDFIFNWFGLLDENATVCYPFVGLVDEAHCLFGLANIRRAWGGGPFTNSTALQQNSFWLTKSGNTTVGVLKYTTSSAYRHGDAECVVQFEGVVMWHLSATNHSAIEKWFEMPDSNRIANTYPCRF